MESERVLRGALLVLLSIAAGAAVAAGPGGSSGGEPVAPASVAGAGGETGAGCHAIADRDARLACYDRVTGRAAPAGAARPAEVRPHVAEHPVVPSAPDAAPVPAGLPPSPAGLPPAPAGPPPARPGRAEPPKYSDVLEVRIVGIESVGLGRHRFRLENGQVWEQLEAHSITLGQGDRVNVRQTLFGAWRMRDEDSGSRSVKVRRIE